MLKKSLPFLGGASVNFQMLNEESRKYFNRAFSMSDTALNYYALSEKNHLKRMQDCTKIYDKRELVEYLKTTWTIVLSHCTKLTIEKTLPDIPWGPTIESPNTKGAFITEKPEQIYKSDKAPTMDAMFSFTSQVNISKEKSTFWINTILSWIWHFIYFSKGIHCILCVVRQ